MLEKNIEQSTQRSWVDFCPGAIVGFLTHPSAEAFVKCQDEIKKVMNEV